jgi:hypothetical protein
MENKNKIIQDYEYAELTNQLTSLHAERLRLIEAEAETSTAMTHVNKQIRRYSRLAERMAVERGIERTCAGRGIEPEGRTGRIVAVLAFSVVASVIVFTAVAFAGSPEAVQSPESVPETQEVSIDVQAAGTPVIEAQAVQVAARVLTSTDGQPTADQIQTIREICLVGYDELYGEQMTGWNIGRSDFGRQCEADLLAMAWAESRFNCSVVGDNGHSLGCFQVHDGYHDVADADRLDFAFSAAWTLDRLVKHGYPHYRTAAIRSHNGSGEAAGRYAEAVKNWSFNYSGI